MHFTLPELPQEKSFTGNYSSFCLLTKILSLFLIHPDLFSCDLYEIQLCSTDA